MGNTYPNQNRESSTDSTIESLPIARYSGLGRKVGSIWESIRLLKTETLRSTKP